MGPKRLRRGLAIIAGAVIAYVLALLFIPSSHFPLKSRLEEQELLIPAISFFSIVGASFIGGLILVAVNEKIQTYSWKRDQALMDIKDIYMPLYDEMADIARYTTYFQYPKWVPESWQTINNSPLGAKLQIMEPKFYDRLRQLYEDFENYRQGILAAYKMAEAAAREVIEKRLDKSIVQGNVALTDAATGPSEEPGQSTGTIKDEILVKMLEVLDEAYDVYSGFLKGKSVTEWSKFLGIDDQEIPEWLYKKLQKSRYWKPSGFGTKEIEEMLDEIYHKVRADKTIMGKASWCESYNQRAIQLKKELEERIITPQLS